MLIGRRAFLKSMGLVGAAGLAGCRGAPLERMYAYLTPPEHIVPGVAAYYATVCRACPAGCGILVRTREARPIKLEGNPAHPVNRGRLCARGQAFIQSLYSRDRVSRPMVRAGGKLVKSTWKRAYALIRERLSGARSVGFLTGLESGSFEDLVADISSGFETPRHVVHEPVALSSMATAAGILFGRVEVPEIRLDGVDRVVSFGADILDAWVSPVLYSRQWAEGHAFSRGRTMRMEYVGPRRNLTATAADEWVRAGTDEIGPLVLALAWELVDRKAGPTPEQADRQREVLMSLGPRPTLSAERAGLVAGMADRLARARRGLVLYGGAEVLTRDATAVHCAALVMNAMTGSLGTALGFGAGTALSRVSPDAHALDLLEAAASAEVDVLFVHGTNPAYTLPAAARVREKLEAAPLVVCLASEHTETSDAADVVIPVHHPLESWGDYAVSSSVHGLMQPVRTPVHATRHAGDVLIRLAALSGRAVRRGSFKDYVVSRWAARLGIAAGEEPGPRWERALVEGGVFEDPGPRPAPSIVESAGGQVPALESPARGGIGLVTSVGPLVYDGRGATQDWLLEVPDPVLQTSWEVPVEVPSELARASGVSDGDRVELSGPAGAITAPAIVCEDMAPGCVALRMGGGRSRTREDLASGSVMQVMGLEMDPRSGELALSGSTVTLRRVSDGSLVRVTGEERPGDRPLHVSVPEASAREGRWPVFTRHGEVEPDAEGRVHGERAPLPHEEAGGTRPSDNIVELQRHPDHRWGLVVDLDLCTGCGACAVACYAENNVPVVGKEQVMRGRELSWIRIESHVFGHGADRDMRFLPVMCQQCDQAPCETVCPVFASYHTPDGLNAQIYNRCIGTRYCANNCPYKVRRFNWLKWPREPLARQQLNPDVTVRSRGVMEKCTFCIQRIREVTNRAKSEGRQVGDGEIQPACVQTCPTGALAFGDFKRQDWQMSRLARDPRAYRLLDHFLNTRPGVVYLRKVLPAPEEK